MSNLAAVRRVQVARQENTFVPSNGTITPTRPVRLPLTTTAKDLIAAQREEVYQSFRAAETANYRAFLEGDDKATAQYIFENQREDALKVAKKFEDDPYCRIVSVQKKTKLGADGFMVYLAHVLTTHSDDCKVVDPKNVRILTAMSNVQWERDMIEKTPGVFKKCIFHHGKLSKSDLTNLKNGLIIIDEIDNGDKEYQVLHSILNAAGVLDIQHMIDNNNRFVIISATMIKELQHLYRWGRYHKPYTMEIPENYCGHIELLNMGIIKEFYPLNNPQNAERWLNEDIFGNYGTEYRVHIVRVTNKTVDIVHNACIRYGVQFMRHTSTEILTPDEINVLFNEPLTSHVVLAVKGFLRRANLICNRWKLIIGAMHEHYSKKVDNNVQIQGLVGRMTGYWLDVLRNGHKTGPYRTSIDAVLEYEQVYTEPFGDNDYQTNGFVKRRGRPPKSKNTLLSPHNIRNLVAIPAPVVRAKGQCEVLVLTLTIDQVEQFSNHEAMLNVIRMHDEAYYRKYHQFIPACWRIDTPEKEEKYGLRGLLEPNALSTVTNIRHRTRNYIMMYLHEEKLIVSPWKGEDLLNNVEVVEEEEIVLDV